MSAGRLVAVAGTLLLLSAASCDDEAIPVDATPQGPLLVATAWSWADRVADDPFPDHRPADVKCPDVAWQVEGGSLEVSTSECNYLTLAQPLLHDVVQGATIEVTMWHQALHANEPAEAHVALAVGGDVVWQRQVAIPGPADVWRDEVVAQRPLWAGERVVLHLHNHGANTWNLGDVMAR